ncbi:hypothetical protein B296_00037009 [Ensete ventricosum]|uniref:Uncharacterized protein n=1 Tax=Ensete ventricosum TaxID=4639 RepID=A0A426ZAU1_ENSVE|nr:hypothetical protein B296_00037009 [Ensete ventricosum]
MPAERQRPCLATKAVPMGKLPAGGERPPIARPLAWKMPAEVVPMGTTPTGRSLAGRSDACLRVGVIADDTQWCRLCRGDGDRPLVSDRRVRVSFRQKDDSTKRERSNGSESKECIGGSDKVPDDQRTCWNAGQCAS